MQYVGETKRRFITRFKEHLADIKHKRDTPVSLHFNKPDHINLAKPLPKILNFFTGSPDNTTEIRKNKEKQWIHLLKTITPWGINLLE